MIVKTEHTQRQRRGDRAHRRAARALDIAASQYSNGQFNTLAWCAAGRPASGITDRHVTFYQAARSIVHENDGAIRPGDADRLLARLRGKLEATS
jgi:hypothetical protein